MVAPPGASHTALAEQFCDFERSELRPDCYRHKVPPIIPRQQRFAIRVKAATTIPVAAVYRPPTMLQTVASSALTERRYSGRICPVNCETPL